MRNRIVPLLALFLLTTLLSGCTALPFLSFMGSAAGSAYSGYVIWNSGEAIKSAQKEGYSLETKGNVPMHIDILPLEKSVTSVVINISTFGDKHYVELFYSLVDDNLHKKVAVGKEKTR
jgi:mevalonate pyrophosphate decarboxylase